MKLIDADKIGLTDVELIMCEGSYKKVLEALIRNIQQQPAIDAVPVVRCEYCEHWDASWKCSDGSDDHYCYMADRVTDREYFCRDGERKEEQCPED